MRQNLLIMHKLTSFDPSTEEEMEFFFKDPGKHTSKISKASLDFSTIFILDQNSPNRSALRLI